MSRIQYINENNCDEQIKMGHIRWIVVESAHWGFLICFSEKNVYPFLLFHVQRHKKCIRKKWNEMHKRLPLLPHFVRVLTSFLMTFVLLFFVISLSVSFAIALFSLNFFSLSSLRSMSPSISIPLKVLFIRFVCVFICGIAHIHLSQHIVNVINVWRIFICKLHLSNRKWHINIFIKPTYPSTHPLANPQVPYAESGATKQEHTLMLFTQTHKYY